MAMKRDNLVRDEVNFGSMKVSTFVYNRISDLWHGNGGCHTLCLQAGSCVKLEEEEGVLWIGRSIPDEQLNTIEASDGEQEPSCLSW
jgi:hypothetical protein